MTIAADGRLWPWSDVAPAFREAAILLGNGLSINVWERFAYRKLYDHARAGALTATDRELFGGTPNFERALGDLGTALRVCQLLGMDTQPILRRYSAIQDALGQAVRAVHVPRARVTDDTLVAIREELKRYRWVFTTSYDLIIYWAMGCREGFRPFADLFRGADLTFDPRRADAPVGTVPVFFLHGALHLVVDASGTTWKLRSSMVRNLLEQYGAARERDPSIRPLLVTEGSAQEKLRAIEDNVYLDHALEELRRCDLPMVVFGSSLDPQDDHLLDALNEAPDRAVAVALMPGPERAIAQQQVAILTRLETDAVTFYDATTHPLGARGLRATP